VVVFEERKMRWSAMG
jgi:hypothetical protein